MKKKKRRRLSTVHLTADEFWSSWHELLAAFAATDDEYITRRNRTFEFDRVAKYRPVGVQRASAYQERQR